MIIETGAGYIGSSRALKMTYTLYMLKLVLSSQGNLRRVTGIQFTLNMLGVMKHRFAKTTPVHG